MSPTTVQTADLTDAQFSRISALVKSLCGINLHTGKKELVRARLNKRLRKLNISCFDEYLDYVRDDSSGTELTFMLDNLSTNLTSFFREAKHFEVLREHVLEPLEKRADRNRKVRIWCAGCSSGEEAYCLAITLREAISNLDRWDARILATDLSTRVLETARAGKYRHDRIKTVPPQIRNRYFTCVETKPEKMYRVNQNLKSLIHFGRLNLMESWPMKGPFDAIFCRNVMIYFDKPTQGKLVNRFYDLLAPGGTLFIGHSESLTGIQHKYRYVQPTVYQK